jgi:hypothetical protein
MAKAVVPLRAFRDKYGELPAEAIGAKLQEFVHEFLQHDPSGKPEKLEVKSQKVEVKG